VNFPVQVSLWPETNMDEDFIDQIRTSVGFVNIAPRINEGREFDLELLKRFESIIRIAWHGAPLWKSD
jgi:hypothetical protein